MTKETFYHVAIALIATFGLLLGIRFAHLEHADNFDKQNRCIHKLVHAGVPRKDIELTKDGCKVIDAK